MYLSTSGTYERFGHVWEGLDSIPVDFRNGAPDVVVNGAKISLAESRIL
jgi:hypothetical protein